MGSAKCLHTAIVMIVPLLLIPAVVVSVVPRSCCFLVAVVVLVLCLGSPPRKSPLLQGCQCSQVLSAACKNFTHLSCSDLAVRE